MPKKQKNWTLLHRVSSNQNASKIAHGVLLGFPILAHPVFNVLSDVKVLPLCHIHHENATIEYTFLGAKTLAARLAESALAAPADLSHAGPCWSLRIFPNFQIFQFQLCFHMAEHYRESIWIADRQYMINIAVMTLELDPTWPEQATAGHSDCRTLNRALPFPPIMSDENKQ